MPSEKIIKSTAANRGKRSIVLLIVFLPLLLALGLWQVQRAQEKQILEAHYRTIASQPPVEIESTAKDHLLDDGRLVSIQGKYDNRFLWYLDNQIYQGRAGYEVICPFRLENGIILLVNRGWWKGSADRSRLPEVPVMFGTHHLVGQVYRPSGKQLLLRSERPTRHWPKRIQAVDLKAMAAELKGSIYPALIRLNPGQPGTRPAMWERVTISSARHTGYALTWFTLAGVLCLLCWGEARHARRERA